MLETRSRRTAALLLALLVFAGLTAAACGRSEALANNQGNDSFYEEEYEAALELYEAAQAEAPDFPEPIYNSANVHYRNSEFEDAQEDLLRTLLDADEELARASLFNQGNTFYKTAELEKAIDSYKEVLRLDPDDRDAKHNLELALRELESGPDEGETAPDEELPQEGDQPSDGERQGEDQSNQGQGGEQEEEERDQDVSGPQDEPGDTQDAEEQDTAQAAEGSLNEQQARRLLESVGQSTETLQGHLQRTFVSQEDPPERDW
jgi:tetratricopeptide (TPR) repeat protein